MTALITEPVSFGDVAPISAMTVSIRAAERDVVEVLGKQLLDQRHLELLLGHQFVTPPARNASRDS